MPTVFWHQHTGTLQRDDRREYWRLDLGRGDFLVIALAGDDNLREYTVRGYYQSGRTTSWGVFAKRFRSLNGAMHGVKLLKHWADTTVPATVLRWRSEDSSGSHKEGECSLIDFLHDNSSDDEIVRLAARLQRGGSFSAGGGAAPVFEVKRVK